MNYADTDSGCFLPAAGPRRADDILKQAASWYDAQIIAPGDLLTQRVNEMVTTMRLAELRCALPITYVAGGVGDPDAPPTARRYVL